MPDSNDHGRVHRRVPLSTDVRVTLEGIEQFAGFLTDNISEGGLFIKTDSPLPRGTKIHVSVALRNCDAILESDAEVAWVRTASPGQPAGMGVRFLDLAPEYQKLLSSFISTPQESPRFNQGMGANDARHVFELVILAAMADGERGGEEAKTVAAIRKETPMLAALADVATIGREIDARAKLIGVEPAAREVAAKITERSTQELVMKLCAQVSQGDGELDVEEATLLLLLQKVFGFSDADLDRILG